MGLDMVRTSCPRVGKVSLDRVRSSLHVVRMRDFAPGNVRADNISSVTFSHECYIQNSRKDAGGLGTAQQRLHTSEQPPCYPDYKARRGNGPTKRTKAENSQVENETPKTPETLCRMSLDIGEPARLVALSI
ncbi:uncharacterized protein LOC119178475 isoform X10 [Rhipicephalus microplus]|uniref:uncharacterized protein LOC119178475 isoform X10 n=1 Tax=Rhipicephalus microplus TaxID=6941 RepID=UPI003F6BDB91